MRVPSLLAAVVLAGVLLAGCSSPGPRAPAEVLVESKPPEEVRSSDEAAVPAFFEPEAKTRGHLAGVVVDEAIRPLQGATVRLPGMDLARTTDRDGSFGFVDLHPGPYFLTVEMEGYYSAEAMLEVSTEEFTRAKVILQAIPPAEPYHVTQSFDGYTELTGDPVLGLNLLCTSCRFDFYIERDGLHTAIFEATSGSGVEGDGFYVTLLSADEYLVSEMQPDPARIELREEDLGEDESFELRAEPSTLVPATARRFQVFVTAFYNGEPPLGWSFVAGDV